MSNLTQGLVLVVGAVTAAACVVIALQTHEIMMQQRRQTELDSQVVENQVLSRRVA